MINDNGGWARVGKDIRLRCNRHLGFISFERQRIFHLGLEEKEDRYVRQASVDGHYSSRPNLFTCRGPALVEGLEEFVAPETPVATEGAPVSSLQRSSGLSKKKICHGFTWHFVLVVFLISAQPCFKSSLNHWSGSLDIILNFNGYGTELVLIS